MKRILFLLLPIIFLFYSEAIAQKYETHKVKQGETIASIANDYKVSKEAIYRLNPDAKKGNLMGTVLVIPLGEPETLSLEKTPVIKFKEYHVKPKETLYSIAKRNKITVADIKKYNTYLENEELGKDDVIKIPVFREKDTVNLNNSVQKSTFPRLQHIVMPKETLFGISQKYGMSVEQLKALNPNAGTLTPGQILNVVNIKRFEENEEENNVPDGMMEYVVKPKENFYRLTKRFNISKDSLELLNPALKTDGLKAGMTLRLPARDNQMLDTLNIIKGNKFNPEDFMKNRNRKNLAVMLPFGLNNFKKDSIDKEKELKNDRVLRISLDFYSGVQAAIQRAEQLGIPVSVKVYDTQKSKSKTQELLDTYTFENYDAVIGPLLSNNVELVSKALQESDTPVLSPLIDAELKGGNNLVQTRPSKLMLEKALFSYIDKYQDEKNMIVLTDKEHNYLESKLAYTFPQATLVQRSEKGNLSTENLKKALKEEKENWVIIESDNLEFLMAAVSFLNQKGREMDIKLFTSDKSDPYRDEISNEYLSNLKFTYASIAKESHMEDNFAFIETYQKEFGILPNKFATRGFDVTMDLIYRLCMEDDLYKALDKKGYAEYVENKFYYHKKMMGGYYNDAVYIIEYQEDMELKVVN